MTFPISASGTGGIETVVNVLEPVHCLRERQCFPERMAVIAERTHAMVHRVSATAGTAG